MIEEIEKGEFYPLTTEKQKKAARKVIKKSRRGKVLKRSVMSKIHPEHYKNKADAKQFIQNLILSSNHYLASNGREEVVLAKKQRVENK